MDEGTSVPPAGGTRTKDEIRMDAKKDRVEPVNTGEQKGSRPQRRPLGVSIIGYAYVLLFGTQGLLSVGRLAVSHAAREEMRAALGKLGMQMPPEQFKSILAAIVIAQGIFSFAYLVLGVGLLKKQEWARSILMYFILVSAVIALAVSVMQPQFAFYMILFLLYPAAVFWYLTKAEIREWFKRTST